MKYYFNYQYLPRGAERPIDAGIAIEVSEDQHRIPPTLPSVGDYVQLNYMTGGGDNFSGKVRSRLFTYFVGERPEQHGCAINIVVEEDDDDWGKLIKE